MYVLCRPVAGVLAAIGILVAAAVPAAAEGPFSSLGGRWIGGGKIVYAGGKSESLRCTATYIIESGGLGVRQNIRCSAASTNFAVATGLKANGNKVTGTWNETIHNASGDVTGSVNAGTVTVGISGSFAGSMSVSTTGSSQSVSIKPSGNTVDRISLSLRKG
jgi:hypothetical protein